MRRTQVHWTECPSVRITNIKLTAVQEIKTLVYKEQTRIVQLSRR